MRRSQRTPNCRRWTTERSRRCERWAVSGQAGRSLQERYRSILGFDSWDGEGTGPGRFVQIRSARQGDRDDLEATLAAHEVDSGLGRVDYAVRRLLVGPPLRSTALAEERMGKLLALPVLSADALSSVAYGPEAMLAILVLAGSSRLSLSLGPLYAFVQLSTTLVLLIAANAAVNGFPRLLYFMARDRYVPRMFLHMGDRLAFTAGIVVLAVPAAILYAAFDGLTEPLIPLVRDRRLRRVHARSERDGRVLVAPPRAELATGACHQSARRRALRRGGRHRAVHPIALDRRLALQLKSELNEERHRVREVADDYANVVHALDCHVLDGRHATEPVGELSRETDRAARARHPRRPLAASAPRRASPRHMTSTMLARNAGLRRRRPSANGRTRGVAEGIRSLPPDRRGAQR